MKIFRRAVTKQSRRLNEFEPNQSELILTDARINILGDFIIKDVTKLRDHQANFFNKFTSS